MAQPETTYVRLPGRARKRLGLLSGERCQLWLGNGHLLHVRRKPYSEGCKRFYLRDIQAFVVSTTPTATAASVILVFLVMILGLLALQMAASEAPWALGLVFFFGTLAAVFAGLLALNIRLGPTCLCRLHTAVQIEHLESLGRLRTARRTIDMLKPLIEEVQGRLIPEDRDVVAAAPAQEAAPVGASPHAIPAGLAAEPRPAQRHELGTFHALLFCSSLVIAASTFTDIFYQHPIKNLFDTLFFGAAVIVGLIAVIRQRNSDVPRSLANAAKAALFALLLNFAASTYIATLYVMMNPGTATPGIVNLNMRLEGPVFTAYWGIAAIIHTAIALFGLSCLREFRRYRA